MDPVVEVEVEVPLATGLNNPWFNFTILVVWKITSGLSNALDLVFHSVVIPISPLKYPSPTGS